MTIRIILPLFLFLSTINNAFAEKSHLVTMPIWEPSQLTCSWWLANKGRTSRDNTEAIAAAFIEGYKAGRSGTTNLHFDNAGKNLFSGAITVMTPMQIDDYCKKYPQEAWTRALMMIYQESLEPPPPPPPPPGMKRQIYDKALKRWVDLE